MTPDDKKIIDLEHREERRKHFDEHREQSDSKYARKDYEKAVMWAIIALASGVFIAVVNTVTGGLIRALMAKL